MTSSRLMLLSAAGFAALALAGCNKAEAPAEEADTTEATATADANDPIASAESAAPEAVAKSAAIATMGADGKMTELRPGTNGWTCMPDSPTTPGPDPMCMDANAMEFIMAWASHSAPPTDRPGIMYMLKGGTDSSNLDPYATEPDGAWIETGPHMMLVGSTAALNGYKGGAHPDTKAPYIMWEGTPYAHLMIPVG